MKTLLAAACSALALSACATYADYPNAPVPVHSASSPQPKVLSVGQWNGEAELAAHDFAVSLKPKSFGAPFCFDGDRSTNFSSNYSKAYFTALVNEGVPIISGPYCRNKIVVSANASGFNADHGYIADSDARTLPMGKMLSGEIPRHEVAVYVNASISGRALAAQTTVYYFAQEDQAHYVPAPAPLPVIVPVDHGRVFSVQGD